MQRTLRSSWILGSLAIAVSGCASEKKSTAPETSEPVTVAAPSTPAPKSPARSEELEPYSCGTVQRLHTWNGIFAGSQPAAADLNHAKENGIKTVLDLRPASEDAGFDEAALAAELGLAYYNVPFAAPAELTDEVFDRALALLRDESKRPVFFHCHSGNRVGAIWLAFRALDGGLSPDAALDEAKQVGLKSPALEQRALDYVQRKTAAPRSGA